MVRGGASASPAGREFEIAYVDAESGARRLALIDAWSVPFEECMPVRGFPSYKGQRNHVGRWWTATTGSLVGYESWLERDWPTGCVNDAVATQDTITQLAELLPWASRPLPAPGSSAYTSRTALLTKRRAVRSTTTWLPGVHDAR